MRIRTKLLSGFLIVVALLFASVVTNGWSLTQLDQASATVQKEADRAAAAQQVARAASDMLAVLGQASSSQDIDNLMEVINQARADLSEAQSALSEVVADLPEKDEVLTEASLVQTRVSRVDSLSELIVPSIEAGRWESVQHYQNEMLGEYYRIVNQPVENIIALTKERQAAAIAEAAATRRFTSLVLSGFAVLALVAGLAVGLTVSRSITNAVTTLTQAAERISMGELDAAVTLESKDEMGDLAQSFERMRVSLKAAMDRLRQK
jgi:methyl-accepting chemotaxis protein